MLEAYQHRLAYVQSHPGNPLVTLPFTAAAQQRMATAAANLADLIQRPGLSPRIPLAQRGFLPQRRAASAPPPAVAVTAPKPGVMAAAFKVPTPSPALSPLAVYLRSYLNTLRRQPAFARVIPPAVASIGVAAPENNVVYLLDGADQIVGRIEPYRENGREMTGMFVAATTGAVTPFQLDLSRPPLIEAAATTAGEAPLLLEPTRSAPRPACAGRAGVAEALPDADFGEQAVDLQVDRGVEAGHVGAAAVGTGDAQRTAVGQRGLRGNDCGEQGQDEESA